MKQLMAAFMVLLVTALAVPVALAKDGATDAVTVNSETGDSQVQLTAEVGVTNNDTNSSENQTDNSGSSEGSSGSGSGSSGSEGSQSDSSGDSNDTNSSENETEVHNGSDDTNSSENQTESQSGSDDTNSSENESQNSDNSASGSEGSSTDQNEQSNAQNSGSESASAPAPGSEAEDVADAQDMQTTHGAQVRLLVLEREITRAELHMNAAIKVVQDSNNSNSSNKTEVVTHLKAISAEMDALKKNVADAVNDTNESAQLQVFLDSKNSARDLIKEFRETAATVLTKADRDALKAAFGDIDRTQLKGINDEIKQIGRDAAADKLQAFLDNAGLSNPDLVAKLRAGTISLSDVRKEIKAQIEAMTPEQRKALAAKLGEKGVKARVQLRDEILKLRSGALERRSKEAQIRSNVLQKLGLPDASKRAQKRSDNLQIRSDVLKARSDGEHPIAANIKARVGNRNGPGSTGNNTSTSGGQNGGN
jgi:23S rRNA A2030 N6-methylase RlmJ